MEIEINKLIIPIGSEEDRYLKDESCYEGCAYEISFPRNEKQLAQIIKYIEKEGKKITVQGSLTGITGAGVPVKSHIINMSKMNKVLDVYTDNNLEKCEMWVESGATFDEIEKKIRKEIKNEYFFPVMPSEKTATIGGAIASGSIGFQSHYYGDLEKYIKEIQVYNYKGELKICEEGTKEWAQAIRSEGMLGVISKIKLRLVKKAPIRWGIYFFFEDYKNACSFTEKIKKIKNIDVLEYMDKNTIELIQKYKPTMSAISEFPDVPNNINDIIFIEIFDEAEDVLEQNLMNIMEICIEEGSDPDVAWAMSEEDKIEDLRIFRHTCSECVNMEVCKYHAIEKRIKKMSVDIRWEKKESVEILNYYKKDLEKSGLTYYIFGHLGIGHVYVNIVAENTQQYEKGKLIVQKWIHDAYKNGEKVFKEHGVGKLKKGFFCKEAPIEEINRLLKAKQKWDPKNLFNPKNMFHDSVL